MRRLAFPATFGEATAESERVVAWLRVPAIGLLALGEGLAHPNREESGFLIALAIYSAWSAGALAWVYLRPAGSKFALLATGVDIAAITALAVLSGGPFSQARLAFFLIPVAVAFRFRPAVTAAAAIVTTIAYVTQAVLHPARSEPQAARFILVHTGYLAWVGLACFLLSLLLARSTGLVGRLAEERSQLLADALSAEQRERKALAEALHDQAVQNLLSARHELEEASEELSHPSLDRAQVALTETVEQLREAIFELHPYVLDEAGLEAGLRSIAQHASARGGFDLRLDLHYDHANSHDQLLFSAARELLANVVNHADAQLVTLRLGELNGDVELVVEDDGQGFPQDRLAEQLANGHVGLASQRIRIEAAGGRMHVASSPGQGTRVQIRVPGS